MKAMWKLFSKYLFQRLFYLLWARLKIVTISNDSFLCVRGDGFSGGEDFAVQF